MEMEQEIKGKRKGGKRKREERGIGGMMK